MADRGRAGYMAGKDASYAKPTFVPDDKLRARDDSGGLNYDRHSAEFGDGGYVFPKDKKHLMPGGGSDTANDDGEVNENIDEKKEKART